MYQIFSGVAISHETVRKAQIITDDLFYLNNEIIPSGFYGYDVQWEPLDDGFHYRHLLFDLVNNAPVAELLSPNEDLKTSYDFINKSLKPKMIKIFINFFKFNFHALYLLFWYLHISL